MSLMLNTGAMQYRTDAQSAWQPLVLMANVDLASLADRFSTSSTYEVGEYVLYDGAMYRCITAVTTAGAWDSSKWVEVVIGDELSALNAALDNLCLKATSVVTVSGNGTTTHTLTGLTADHEISNWGMFTDAALTTPIPSNNPTCDVMITPGAGSWTLLIENFGATFYIRPTFILPQN